MIHDFTLAMTMYVGSSWKTRNVKGNKKRKENVITAVDCGTLTSVA